MTQVSYLDMKIGQRIFYITHKINVMNKEIYKTTNEGDMTVATLIMDYIWIGLENANQYLVSNNES